MNKKYKIGIIGTGFIARGLMYVLKYRTDMEVVAVLTRRKALKIDNFPLDKSIITNDVSVLLKKCDLVVECSGDVIHGTEMAEKVLEAGIPVVTMNSELQIVSGTYLSRKGIFIEAEGDQPGSLAALDFEVKSLGFQPIVYGNIKRFLNLNPTKEEMEYWSKRQGISMAQVTAFTDGTKVQIEQALVANGLGADILCRNLSGIPCKALEDGAHRLAEMAEGVGKPISDYVLSPIAPAGIFIVAKHNIEQKPYLEYLKLGEGPYYVIVKPFHLCHLEIPKTILNVLKGNKNYSFNNGNNPTIQVVAVAKRKIEKDEIVRRGLGGFDVRGEAVKIKNFMEAVPVGLLAEARFLKPVGEGRIINFSDVELPCTRALEIWKDLLEEIKKNNQ